MTEFEPLSRLYNLVRELLEDADGDTVEIQETMQDAIREYRWSRSKLLSAHEGKAQPVETAEEES